MRMGRCKQTVLAISFSVLFFLSGCHILDGGMNTVDPPTLSSLEPPTESILNDLSPIRPRDLMADERREPEHRD